ncbi:MAG: 2-dehydropantoate 2-reductase [Sediminicola sp.]
MLSSKAHIYIIGAGAIGKALAVFLGRAGKNVTLIRGSIHEGPRKYEDISIKMPDGTAQRSRMEITTLDNLSMINGIIVLANKSFGNGQLAVSLKAKTGNSPIVLLQNGLGIEEPFMRLEYPEIYRSVLFVTGQAIDPCTVRFKPVDICPVGIERGNQRNLDTIVDQLNTTDFKFKSELHIQQVIWKKTIINCVFNSVCPLLEVDNGIFQRNAEALKIARNVISECIAIASAKGIELDADEVESSLMQISRLSAGQEISTLQDIRNKKRTEIGTLNLEIARIAETLNKMDLVPQTSLLGKLTKLKADINMSIYKGTENMRS